MKIMSDITTIQLYKKTVKRLKKSGSMGQTYDDRINELLDELINELLDESDGGS